MHTRNFAIKILAINIQLVFVSAQMQQEETKPKFVNLSGSWSQGYAH
jgi:hypothetical protein